MKQKDCKCIVKYSQHWLISSFNKFKLSIKNTATHCNNKVQFSNSNSNYSKNRSNKYNPSFSKISSNSSKIKLFNKTLRLLNKTKKKCSCRRFNKLMRKIRKKLMTTYHFNLVITMHKIRINKSNDI